MGGQGIFKNHKCVFFILFLSSYESRDSDWVLRLVDNDGGVWDDDDRGRAWSCVKATAPSTHRGPSAGGSTASSEVQVQLLYSSLKYAQ